MAVAETGQPQARSITSPDWGLEDDGPRLDQPGITVRVDMSVNISKRSGSYVMIYCVT